MITKENIVNKEPFEIGIEMITVLCKALDRKLTDEEVSTIHWLSHSEYKTSGTMLELFRELSKRVEEGNEE